MKFKEVVEKNLSSLREDTEMVALQLVSYNRNLFSMLTFYNIGRLHTQSESDNRTHFTAVETNGQRNVSTKRHFPVD